MEAEVAYQRAIALEPKNAYTHMMYALQCSFLGRHDEALRQAVRALEIEPLDPMTNFRLVQSWYYARRYEEAVRTGRTAIELSRDFPYTHWYIGYDPTRHRPRFANLVRRVGLDRATDTKIAHPQKN